MPQLRKGVIMYDKLRPNVSIKDYPRKLFYLYLLYIYDFEMETTTRNLTIFNIIRWDNVTTV